MIHQMGVLSFRGRTDSNLMKFHKVKCPVCPWGRITPCSSTGSGLTIWKAVLQRWTLVCWQITDCQWTSNVPSQQRNPVAFWIRQSIARRLREETLSLCSALERHIWSVESSAELPSIRETGTYWIWYSKGPWRWLRHWNICPMRRD